MGERALSRGVRGRFGALLIAAASLSCASCAALWGFDDASGPGDGGSLEAATLETGIVDTSSPTHDAGGDAIADVGAATADHTAPGQPDQGAPPVATCVPGCAAGATCELAVGGASTCVDSTSCTESTQCLGSTCCVWLTYDSGTGRCEATGFNLGAASLSCLCTGKGSPGGPPATSCKSCKTPTAYPNSGVKVCTAF